MTKKNLFVDHFFWCCPSGVQCACTYKCTAVCVSVCMHMHACECVYVHAHQVYPTHTAHARMVCIHTSVMKRMRFFDPQGGGKKIFFLMMM